ncbi:cytosolic carboxypeptidase 2-like [Argonauta hians]
MRPLVYSEEEFKRNGIGWKRTGHHILYSRNMTNLQCPLLTRGTPYFMLEWQMEFPHTEGHYYLAHCYPYTFSDLKDDLDDIISQPGTSQWIKREVLCETRAGNSCFLITVTDFDCDDRNKEGVVLSARVHPGESQASWMMRGVLYFLTGSHPTAQELRKKFIFKIVPMLNPDGVIIGNYRCSLIGRDLNRNFRHPIKSSCPTVWYLKSMIEELSKKHQIMLYCDLHGHSRKHNVFMYGNNTSDKDNSALAKAKSFLNDRLFPWITALQAPDKFSFTSCKFRIRKCKESTGRVVMWRQLHIANSFTMEAAFSGSVLDRGQKPCHFNTRDYEDMGKSLCLAIYQFHRAQADRRLQAQLTISLTRQVTQQLRKNNNGAITSNGTVPQLKDFIRENRQNRKVKNNEHPTEVAQSASSTVRPDVKRDKREGEVIHDGSDGSSIPEPPPPPPPETATTATTTTQEMTSPFEDGIDDLLDADGDDELNEENGKPVDAMEGCLNLLLSLNATEVLMESDSSDSDSDTDSEIKSEPQKPPQRRRDSHKKRTRFSPPNNPKPLPPQKIPTTKETTRKTINVPPAVPKEEPKIPKYFPHFVSKYEGRTNGGIPCFSEERCIERTAAKRMVNMKETFEDQEQTDEHIEPEYQNLGFLPRYWSQLVAGSNSLKDILDPSSGSDEGDKKGVQFGDNPENSVPGLVVISENCKSNETTTDHNNPRQTSCVLKPQHRPLEQLNLPLKYRLLRTNKIEQNNFETISKPLRPP